MTAKMASKAFASVFVAAEFWVRADFLAFRLPKTMFLVAQFDFMKYSKKFVFGSDPGSNRIKSNFDKEVCQTKLPEICQHYSKYIGSLALTGDRNSHTQRHSIQTHMIPKIYKSCRVSRDIWLGTDPGKKRYKK